MKTHEAYDEFYTKGGKLKRVKSLKPWPLMSVLMDKYRLTYFDAYFLSRFLLKMLKWNPKERASAQEMLEDPWLRMQPEYETYVGKTYYKEWKHATDPNYESSSSSSGGEEGEEEESGARAGDSEGGDGEGETSSEFDLEEAKDVKTKQVPQKNKSV